MCQILSNNNSNFSEKSMETWKCILKIHYFVNKVWIFSTKGKYRIKSKLYIKTKCHKFWKKSMCILILNCKMIANAIITAYK